MNSGNIIREMFKTQHTKGVVLKKSGRRKFYTLVALFSLVTLALIVYLFQLKRVPTENPSWRALPSANESDEPAAIIQESPPQQELPSFRTNFPNPEFPSGTKLLLFVQRDISKGASLSQDSFVYRDEKTGAVQPFSMLGMPGTFAVREGSNEIFYFENDEIWKGDFRFRPLKKLTSGTNIQGLFPSPDGTYVAFARNEKMSEPRQEGNITVTDILEIAVYVAKTDGSGFFRVKIPEGYRTKNDYFEAWYPKSDKLLVSSDINAAGSRVFWEFDPEEQTTKRFYRFATRQPYIDGEPWPVISPNGTKFVFVEHGGVHEGWVSLANIDGSDRKIALHGSDSLRAARWAPNGTKFVVMNEISFFIFDENGAIVHESHADQNGYVYGTSEWSKDSRFLFMTLQKSSYQSGPDDPKKIVLLDTLNYSLREFEVKGLPIPPREQGIWDVLAAPSGLFYYRVIPENFAEAEKKGIPFPQLWMVNPVTGENKKLSDSALTLPYAITMP